MALLAKTWGSKSDPRTTQILALQKAYATLILDSSQKLTYQALDSRVPLDSMGVRIESRKLGMAGMLDTTILFPTPSFVLNTAPTFSGAMDISRTLDTTAQVVPNRITAIAAGSKNDSGQSIQRDTCPMGRCGCGAI